MIEENDLLTGPSGRIGKNWFVPLNDVFLGSREVKRNYLPNISSSFCSSCSPRMPLAMMTPSASIR